MYHANEQLHMLAEICMWQGGGFFATAAMNSLTTYHPAYMGPVVLGPSSASSVSSLHDKERAAEDQGAGSKRLAENQQGKSKDPAIGRKMPPCPSFQTGDCRGNCGRAHRCEWCGSNMHGGLHCPTDEARAFRGRR